MGDYATEGSHWYDSQGNPQHTYINSKGKECNTTLREARKFGYKPSVSLIKDLAAKPGLDAWKIDQTIMACLTMPLIEGETEADYIKRLKEDSREQAKKAAEKGTEIHGYIERGFRGEISGNCYYESVKATIKSECGEQEWHTEKSFASSLGYGGKLDLHNEKYLIDFKGTDKPLESLKTWDEHAMQLAAYSYGIKPGGVFHQCGICYIHRDTAESKLIWLKEAEIIKGWECFKALLSYFYAKSGLER